MRYVKLNAEWEYNGRDDSDWHVVAYDTVDNCLVRVTTDTTRFAPGAKFEFAPSTPEILSRSVELLREKYAIAALAQLHNAKTFLVGEKLRLTKKTRIKERVKCEKCAGTGHWVNPKRESDKRTCFSCSGFGYVSGSGYVVVEPCEVTFVGVQHDARNALYCWVDSESSRFRIPAYLFERAEDMTSVVRNFVNNHITGTDAQYYQAFATSTGSAEYFDGVVAVDFVKGALNNV